jgi:flagellar export protein FliJ
MMANFRFKLASVLAYRGRQRNEAEQALAAAQQTLTSAEEALQQSERQQREALQSVTDADLLGGLGFSWNSTAYTQFMKQQQAVLQQKIEQAQASMNQAKLRYVETKRSERALEVLKEAQQSAWHIQQQYEEECMLNELTQQRVARQLLAPPA